MSTIVFSSTGRRFHACGAATENARSPVFNLVDGTTRSPLEADRRWLRETTSATGTFFCVLYYFLKRTRSFLTFFIPISHVRYSHACNCVGDYYISDWIDLAEIDHHPFRSRHANASERANRWVCFIVDILHWDETRNSAYQFSEHSNLNLCSEPSWRQLQFKEESDEIEFNIYDPTYVIKNMNRTKALLHFVVTWW